HSHLHSFPTRRSSDLRGNWLASFYVQPMGLLLALGAGALFWGGLFMALTGAPLHRLAAQTSGVYWTTGLVGFAILAWGWKMFIRSEEHTSELQSRFDL